MSAAGSVRIFRVPPPVLHVSQHLPTRPAAAPVVEEDTRTAASNALASAPENHHNHDGDGHADTHPAAATTTATAASQSSLLLGCRRAAACYSTVTRDATTAR